MAFECILIRNVVSAVSGYGHGNSDTLNCGSAKPRMAEIRSGGGENRAKQFPGYLGNRCVRRDGTGSGGRW